ncbi:hypothetical protein TGRUB_230040 [Toxoplasma gondii RUB]|uniref:Uncharacterized protein n=1 Tax=Toxoplasma gondii RUB TaxID=935652 RepID=A0A086M3S5_TOXGO|nr:hypothetical protein TGRUB_230040 [Toxoplasma gondii RUB]
MRLFTAKRMQFLFAASLRSAAAAKKKRPLSLVGTASAKGEKKFTRLSAGETGVVQFVWSLRIICGPHPDEESFTKAGCDALRSLTPLPYFSIGRVVFSGEELLSCPRRASFHRVYVHTWPVGFVSAALAVSSDATHFSSLCEEALQILSATHLRYFYGVDPSWFRGPIRCCEEEFSS